MCILWVIGAVFYTLVAVRACIVLRRVETRIGRNGKWLPYFGVMWPWLTVFIGLMMLLADDCGVFAPGFKFDDDKVVAADRTEAK